MGLLKGERLTPIERAELPPRMPRRFKWTVEFSVDKSWVADGFDLTRDRAKEMLARDLRGAYNFEISARILSKPDRVLIRKAQGYADAKR